MARYRARWKKYQIDIDPKRLVFIDETWAKTNMAPIRGWFARGRRLEAKVPHGHWKTMTFLAALRHDRIDAPFVFDGPINGESFLLYVEQVLVPTLLAGDIIVMDAEKGILNVELSDDELAARRKAWKPRAHDFQSGTLWKYARLVGDAEKGAVTHPGAKTETHLYADI